MNTTIFSSDKKNLNLTEAMFKVMPTHTGKMFIDTIYFQYEGGVEDNIHTYEQLSKMNFVFCVRKENAKTGFSYYKTFRGLMTRLYEDVMKHKRK
jgi:hypothetical protein